jgi:thiol-disulfide isomerase/thioredoxin
MSDEVQTATFETFGASVLDAKGPIAVEFMSYGCAHCRVMEPILQQVAAAVQPQEKIFRVNVAIEHELASTYAISGTPTLIMFLDGREVGRAEGTRPTEADVLAAVTLPFGS